VGPLEVCFVGLAAVLGLMTLLWLVSLALRNASIVDIFWGAGFVVLAWLYFLLAPQGLPSRKLLSALLVTVWGLRLSLYIFARNRGKGEDFRYVAMRRAAGAGWWWQSYLKVFVLQGVLMWLISAPLLGAQLGATPGQMILDGLGVLVWGIGFFFEAVGDWQLARFRADPANKGQVMNRGLWCYTRHPNYFGDATQWWGFFLIALAAGGWMTVFSPILMTFLLVRVSGKALLEKSMAQRPGYREYIESTSGFVPWFPRQVKGKGS
jgi:steroid 5-alpha reductase family enzyme